MTRQYPIEKSPLEIRVAQTVKRAEKHHLGERAEHILDDMGRGFAYFSLWARSLPLHYARMTGGISDFELPQITGYKSADTFEERFRTLSGFVEPFADYDNVGLREISRSADPNQRSEIENECRRGEQILADRAKSYGEDLRLIATKDQSKKLRKLARLMLSSLEKNWNSDEASDRITMDKDLGGYYGIFRGPFQDALEYMDRLALDISWNMNIFEMDYDPKKDKPHPTKIFRDLLVQREEGEPIIYWGESLNKLPDRIPQDFLTDLETLATCHHAKDVRTVARRLLNNYAQTGEFSDSLPQPNSVKEKIFTDPKECTGVPGELTLPHDFKECWNSNYRTEMPSQSIVEECRGATALYPALVAKLYEIAHTNKSAEVRLNATSSLRNYAVNGVFEPKPIRY